MSTEQTPDPDDMAHVREKIEATDPAGWNAARQHAEVEWQREVLWNLLFQHQIIPMSLGRYLFSHVCPNCRSEINGGSNSTGNVDHITEAILSSDWLAELVARVRAEADAEIVDQNRLRVDADQRSLRFNQERDQARDERDRLVAVLDRVRELIEAARQRSMAGEHGSISDLGLSILEAIADAPDRSDS